jgi:hypothetical protein
MDPDLETPQASVRDRAAIDFALSAIRGLLLINGGAIVALLAFLSNVWTNDASGARELAINLKLPLSYFMAGVFASVLTAMLSYLGQRAINESWYRITWEQNWTAHILVGLGLIAALASLIMFGIGSWWAVDAFIVSTPGGITPPCSTPSHPIPTP